MIISSYYTSFLENLWFRDIKILRKATENSVNVNEIYKISCLDISAKFNSEHVVLNGIYTGDQMVREKVWIITERIMVFKDNSLSFFYFNGENILKIGEGEFILYKYIPWDFISLTDLSSLLFFQTLSSINFTKWLSFSKNLQTDTHYSYGPIYLDIDSENFLKNDEKIIFLDYESIIVWNTIFQVLHYYLYLRSYSNNLYKKCTVKILVYFLQQGNLKKSDLFQDMKILKNDLFLDKDIDDFLEILILFRNKI